RAGSSKDRAMLVFHPSSVNFSERLISGAQPITIWVSTASGTDRLRQPTSNICAMDQNRRDFIKSASALTAVSLLPNTAGFNGEICLFSKHLPAMDWTRMAQALKKLGFGGIDLTVRPGGHVPPERASEDLPKAVAAIRAEGLSVPMITTALT